MINNTSVADVMSQNWVALDGIDTVKSGLEHIKLNQANAIVINKRDNQDEYGIVLLSDIGKQVVGKGRSLERTNLYEIMAKPTLSVHPEMQLRYCVRLFERFGIGQAPVISDGKVVGLISYQDIVMKLADTCS